MSDLESRAALADASGPVTELQPAPAGASPVTELRRPALEESPATGGELIKKTAGEITGLVQLLAGVLAPAFPSLATIYTPATCHQVGAGVAPLCVKRGWHLGGKFAEEIAALAVVGPLALATWQGIKHDLAAADPAPDQAPPGQPASAPPASDQPPPAPGFVPLPVTP